MNATTSSQSLTHIRNFAIIAHIDHGKTTLTDRLLNLTKTVTDHDFSERMMDSNPIEKERGITIKLAPVRLLYRQDGVEYQLNLIDTPGHVDFGYEVSRSLAAGEGALLLIDATQGIQAQTLSNFEKAKNLGLTIIPVLNKIDLPAADVESVTLEAMETFGFTENEFVHVSAKSGLGVPELLSSIIDRIPAPKLPLEVAIAADSAPQSGLTRALVMTSKFDQHKGVIAYVRVVSGELKSKDRLHLLATASSFAPIELGVFRPAMIPIDCLLAGEVGYVATGIKDIRQVKVGDTIVLHQEQAKVSPLPGFQIPQPMVYMELYPIDADEFPQLQDAVAKLSLHDAALVATGTHSVALGNGLRVGFLGILHAEIVLERLRREFDLDLLGTAPSVPYQVVFTSGETTVINTPAEMPDPSLIAEISEPMTTTFVYTPDEYTGSVMQLLRDRRGVLINSWNIGTRIKLEYRIPLAEIITDLHDKLKSASSGFASMEYQLSEYQAVEAVKVTILVNKEPIDALSVITVREKAEEVGQKVVKKLKDVVPRQLFEVPIQASIGAKVIARETLKAFRKDVTAKLYGGDVTRRQKLLKKQAKGKKRLKQFGKIELNQEAFMAVLER